MTITLTCCTASYGLTYLGALKFTFLEGCEGFQNVKLSYLGGMWVLFEFDSLTAKEKFLNHSSIGSWFTEFIQVTSSFENDERIVWISIEGLPIKAWTPNTFRKIASLWGEYVEWEDDDLKSLSYDLSSDGESQEGDVAKKADNNESDVDRVSKSSFMQENDTAHKDANICKKGEVGSHSEDPFNIYGILDGQKNNVCNSCSDEPKFPPGFTPDNNDHEKNVVENIKDTTERVQSLSNKLNDRYSNRGFSSQRSMNSHSQKSKVGGSILDLMDELVTVGQTIGYNMAGLGNKAKRRWIKELCQKHRINFASIQETKAESINGKVIVIKKLKRSNDKKINIQQNLSEVDKLIDQGKSNDEILIKRITLLNDLQELNNRNAMEISQKAKIRWSIEGDENSKYFHDQVQDLERPVTYEEVKRAIWDCGTNKSPGPDGFSFEFYRKYWTTIDDDVFQAVRDFFVNGHFPRGCNSSFIALIPKIQDAKFVKDFRPISLIGSVYKIIAKILANRLCLVLPYLISDVQSAFVANRQILDGPFILNELLSWYETLKAFGFGLKWRNWISSCLNNAMGSMLVNGSPILEFRFHKGLKQGLKINLHKSKLMGIGVSSNVVAAAASLIGCSILTTLQFILLEGGRLTLLKSVLTSIPLYHMSIFKVPIGVLNHLESIRRNFFYGVDGSDRKLAWIGWNMVLTSKKNGGLGVSSFFAHNRALLFKWVWRFLTDGSSLWTRFIKAIFGNKGALDTHKLIPRRSPWQDVILAIHSLQSKGINLMDFIQKKVGNGENTSFWDDSWLGEVALKVLYKRLYALEMCKSISVAEKMGHPSLSHSFRRMPRGGVEQENYGLLCSKVADLVLPNISDRWCWSLEGSQEFSVKSSRILIDNTILPKAEVPTRWLRVVPIKVNVHAWRVCLDKLPTRANLSLRGMDIPSIACPLCNSAVESTSHIFFACPLARQVWRNFLIWWELEDVAFNSYNEWLIWIVNIRLHKQLKVFLEGICYVMWWLIWRFRNQLLFGNSQPRRALLFDDVV
ncbi:RNA-directed DNA polymerase, eukaryota, reverse transcriptase zinc-binding domain protein [Tanacetum coccineum]